MQIFDRNTILSAARAAAENGDETANKYPPDSVAYVEWQQAYKTRIQEIKAEESENNLALAA